MWVDNNNSNNNNNIFIRTYKNYNTILTNFKNEIHIKAVCMEIVRDNNFRTLAILEGGL